MIGDCLLLRPLAGNQPQCLLRFLQQNRHLADIRFWSMSALRVARIRSVERLPVFCYFHPTWMRRMARSVSRAMADGWSVPARPRGQYRRPADMRGNCRHERPELDTARADTPPLGLAVTYLPVFSRLCRKAAARFLNN